MTKLLLLSALKMGIFGGIGFAIMLLAEPFIPGGNSWFGGFMVGYGLNVVVGSAVSSMVEPDEKSSKGYIFFYRYAHSIFNRSTAYAAHMSMWKLFAKPSTNDEIFPRPSTNEE